MKINNQTIPLNKEQEKAVVYKNGPLLVIAGAGSGKTRVITARIAYLIRHHQIAPTTIIALTFTNKAAKEMKERIAKFIGSKENLPFIGTFHSYCVRLLKEHGHLIDTPFISIMDDDDQKKLIHEILRRNNLQKQLSARQAAYHISQMKNKNINLDKPSEQLFDHPLMPDIYCAYQEEKRASKALDFDDLLLESVRLFKQNKAFKKEFQEMVRHILVDEYQDTNIVQRELLKQMALRNKKLALDSICAVGDDDQSIYSWRGATVTNMLNYQKDFPGTKIIKIEQNYRSVQPILEAANQVISHNTERNPKKLWSERKASDRIKLLSCLSEYQESDAITQLIATVNRHNLKQEIAVLYRTHAQSRAIEESLIRNSIPYKIFGGIQFYERKEIKDLFAYLKLIVNPFDRASLFRIINTPTRGFGPKFEEQLYAALKSQPFMTFIDACKDLLVETAGTKKKAIQEFLAIFEGLSAQDKPSYALQLIIERAKYLTFMKQHYEKDEAQTRIENIQELMDALKHFESQKIDTVSLFLEEITLMQEKLKASDDEQPKVFLMTLHGSKGLEFDIIILAGLEQGILPTARALYEDDSVFEEERRLFYVGITRAKERLILSHAKFRYTYGKMSDQMPSQFLDELPQKLVSSEDCTYWNNAQFAQYFAHWFGIKQSDPLAFNTKRNEFASLIKNKINSKQTKIKPAVQTEFKKNQPVKHKKYGTGIVQSYEKKSDKMVVTVRFKSSIKKIVSQFLQTI